MKTTAPVAPPEAELAARLGRSHAVWDELVATLEREHAPVIHQWLCSDKTGTWYLRLKQEQRVILDLLPGDKYFIAVLGLSPAAAIEILSRDFPPGVGAAIHGTPGDADRREIRLLTRNRRDVSTVLRLAAIQLAN